MTPAIENDPPPMSPTQIEINLDWYDGKEIVRVTPRNLQAFEIEKDRAIRLLESGQAARKEFDLLISCLGTWLLQERDRISSAYLTRQDRSLMFVVVTRAVEWDEELVDRAARLDLEIAQHRLLTHIRMNVTVLPRVKEEGLGPFVDGTFCIRLQFAGDEIHSAA